MFQPPHWTNQTSAQKTTQVDIRVLRTDDGAADDNDGGDNKL